MDNHGSLLWCHSFTIGSDKPYQSLWRLRDTEIRPSRKMKMSDGPHGIASHHAEFGYVPVRKMTFVQNCDLYIPVKYRLGIVRPIVIAFFSAFFHTPCEHDYSSRVGFPTHSPKIIS